MYSKEKKRRVLEYYVLAKRCVCKKRKKEGRWLCISCNEKRKNTPFAKRLDDACYNHIKAALDYIRPFKRR